MVSATRSRGAWFAAAMALAAAACADAAAGSCPPKPREPRVADSSRERAAAWNAWTTSGCDANCAAAGLADTSSFVCAYASAQADASCAGGAQRSDVVPLPCVENSDCVVEFLRVRPGASGADAQTTASDEWVFRLGDTAAASRFHQSTQVHVAELAVPSSISRLYVPPMLVLNVRRPRQHGEARGRALRDRPLGRDSADDPRIYWRRPVGVATADAAVGAPRTVSVCRCR
ncbi:hypothetical protein PybrP1_000653 [[Pythium] brassicae (nom. inval.)]|nr:hypothetical protein PybrP1_000653 [[Pythium] brassicae (nom. inval.)]